MKWRKLLAYVSIAVALTGNVTIFAEEISSAESEVVDKVVHEPVYPSTYDAKGKPPKFNAKDEKRGYKPNTLRLKDHEYDVTNLRGNSGAKEDFDKLMEVLDRNEVAYVGKRKMHSFFGHYYDLSGTGIFNSIVDEDLIDIGSLAIVTDADGYSKGYEFTQIMHILVSEQDRHYYGKSPISKLVYEGDGMDRLFVQYCRWDIEYGLLIANVGYRVW